MLETSPFFTPGARSKNGSLALLSLGRDQIPILLRAPPPPPTGPAPDDAASAPAPAQPDEITNTRFGSYPHSTLAGVLWGAQVTASNVGAAERRRGKRRKLAGEKKEPGAAVAAACRRRRRRRGQWQRRRRRRGGRRRQRRRRGGGLRGRGQRLRAPRRTHTRVLDRRAAASHAGRLHTGLRIHPAPAARTAGVPPDRMRRRLRLLHARGRPRHLLRLPSPSPLWSFRGRAGRGEERVRQGL